MSEIAKAVDLSWIERLHPRDWRGEFAKKGSHDIGGGFTVSREGPYDEHFGKSAVKRRGRYSQSLYVYHNDQHVGEVEKDISGEDQGRIRIHHVYGRRGEGGGSSLDVHPNAQSAINAIKERYKGAYGGRMYRESSAARIVKGRQK